MAAPPPLQAQVPHKNRTLTVIIVVMLALLAFIGIVIVGLLVSFDSMAHEMSRQMRGIVEPHFAGSSADTFHVSFLQVKRQPNYLTEHIRVRCQNDMKASIWVADLQKAGIFRTTNAEGQVYYRDGDPEMLRDTADARAVKGFSSCLIVFRVFTTSSNTVWHTRMSIGTTNVVGGFENDGGTDSTLPTPTAITGIETNWPGSYQRDSEIPLADLGRYKILLSIK